MPDYRLLQKDAEFSPPVLRWTHGKSYENRSEKSREEHKMQFLKNNSGAKWSRPLLETF